MATKAFTGGDKLKARLAEIAQKVQKSATLSVGFLEGSTEPDGTSIPMIAAIQEFGAPAAKIPARPFFRTMIKDKSGEWGDALGKLLVEHDYDSVVALDLVGEGMEGQLRDSIIAVIAPPLRPITLMLRDMRSKDQGLVVTGKTVGEAAAKVAAGESNHGASTKPLVDSGNLLDSVAHEVKS